MSAFIQGLQAGTAAAKGWVDAYEAARKRKEEKELKEGLKRAGQLEQTTIPLPESYAPAAPTETQMVTTPYGQRTPTANELSRAQAETQALAAQDAETFQQYQVGGLTRTGTQFAPQEVQRARSEEMARVYEQQGMPAEAMRMRQLGQQQELTGLELDAARRKVATERANQVAMKQLSERFASGDVLDVPNIYQIASETGADPGILVRLAADNLKLTEANVKATNDKLVKDIRKASTSPQTFNELLSKSFDPDPTDNVKPELRQVGNTYQVFYNNQPLSPVFRDTKDVPALSQLASYYTDNIKDKPLETAVQVATLEKIRAQTTEAQAKAAAVPIAGLTQNIALADQYRKQIADIDKALLNYPENTPQYNALIAQRNQVNRALADVNRTLSPTGVTRQPASSAGGPNVEAARAAALSGVNPATNKPWTAQDKKDYERIFNEPFPESKERPAAPTAAPQGLTRPASPRMARAESGRITRIPPAPPEEITTRGGVRKPNPEYAAWVKKYGSQVGLQ